MSMILAMLLLSANAEQGEDTLPAPQLPVMQPLPVTAIELYGPTNVDIIQKGYDNWILQSDGHINHKGDYCAICRALQRFEHAYQVDPQVFREVRALLDEQIIERAANSPCTLSKAETHIERVTEIIYRKRSADKVADQSYKLIKNCQSPEMDAANAAFAKAEKMLCAAKPIGKVKIIRGYYDPRCG
jgi:hypothetical protein